MSTSVIKVENISKSFVISHQEQERYLSLRDVIANNTKRIFSKLKSPGDKESNIITSEIFWALKDVSFDIQPGDRVGIIGRNGAGKSTLLKILSRITEPSSGRISIKGRVASLLEVGTGFHPELTGRENIYLNGAILGMSRVEIRKKFDEIVAFAEIEKFLDTPVKRYSSGMYVRLAFAVAAHLEPEILIVDEVLAVGDAQFQKKCLGKMEDVSKNGGRTVLFVSHQMGTISKLCNKGLLMEKGRLIYNGGAGDAIEKYILAGKADNEEGYIGDDIQGKKKIFISKATLLNNDSLATDQFSFDEQVSLSVEITMNENLSSTLTSLTVLDKFGDYLFTCIESVDTLPGSGNKRNFIFTLPASILAPNVYSFRIAVFRKDSDVYDLVENICSFRINDNGTNMSLFEGFDYGKVILNYTISPINA